MRAARAAHDFGAGHTHAAVGVLLYRIRREGLPEARPSRTALVLGVAVEEGFVTDDAAVGALVVAVPVDAGECPLGAGVLRDLILQGVEALLSSASSNFFLGVVSAMGLSSGSLADSTVRSAILCPEDLYERPFGITLVSSPGPSLSHPLVRVEPTSSPVRRPPSTTNK
jgi:hypothetical protein